MYEHLKKVLCREYFALLNYIFWEIRDYDYTKAGKEEGGHDKNYEYTMMGHLHFGLNFSQLTMVMFDSQ